MSRARIDTPTYAPNNLHHEKTLHALALSIFSDNGIEAATALHELLRWSTLKLKDPSASIPQGKILYPTPTPLLVNSLTKFIYHHITDWIQGPSVEPALTALTILFNLVNCIDSIPNVPNSILIASTPETMALLLRLSYHPYSALTRLAQTIVAQIGRFCNITKILQNKAEEYVSTLCSLFTLANPAKDEQHITIFVNFALLPDNCRLFIDNLGAEVMVNRIAQLLTYPSLTIRDLLLEAIYLFCMTNADFKDATCSSTFILRSLLGLTIPPSEPYETKMIVPFTPCQKACILLLELSDDARVISYLAKFKIQLASAMLKWKSNGLPQLALKVSNASIR
ncbi:hypothetical protein TRFO_01392 [Tritrichomonas foetus]|uniref:Uncharacterized protein n=1 Tax=Tritrichomonas foetus TaxID=1144522 RepID=A0A1J4K770_9EUKA|nr:hypothetical protein TRFO_01392 [Tritrichomonas foetus]|eukprot:OHT07223.1 hypothetical protein TRFO_01392 [Tritrichomonas foetus]